MRTPAVIFLLLISASAAASAAPVLFQPFPENNSFLGGGSVNFTVSINNSFDADSARLYIISENAKQQGEAWDVFVMSCSSEKCWEDVSFAIAGSDTRELFYFTANGSGEQGSLGSENSSLVFTLDRNPPDIGITSPSNNSFVSGNVTVAAGVTDSASGVNESSVQFSAGGEWTNMSGNGTFDSAEFADNTSLFVWVRASDNVGNEANASVNVTADNTPPSVSALNPADGGTVSGSYAFRSNASDALSGIASASVSFAGASFDMTCSSVCSVSVDTSVYADGNYTVTFSASDAAGNAANTTVTAAFKNDEPVITLDVDENSYLSGTENVTAAITNPEGTITSVHINVSSSSFAMSCNADFTSCSYNIDSANITDGSYTMTAYAENTQGYNLADSSAVIVDNTNPTISATVPATASGIVTLKAASTDANPDGNNVKFTIAGSTKAMTCTYEATTINCEAEYDTTLIDDGSYDVAVTATDQAGNSNSTSAGMTVDNSGSAGTGNGADGTSGTSGTGGGESSGNATGPGAGSGAAPGETGSGLGGIAPGSEGERVVTLTELLEEPLNLVVMIIVVIIAAIAYYLHRKKKEAEKAKYLELWNR